MMAQESTAKDPLALTAIQPMADSTVIREALAVAAAPPRVMLIARDRDVRHWGPRWLRQTGIEVLVPDQPRHAVADILAESPDIVLIEASLKDASGDAIYRALLARQADAPLIYVLCKSRREFNAASRLRPFDLLRKPFDWELVARRVGAVADGIVLKRRLDASERARRKAEDYADDARMQLKSRDSYEPVTGLPNQQRFKDIVTRSMAATTRDANQLAVIVVGFSRFRLVVEAMGQRAADKVISQIGQSLSETLRSTESRPSHTQGFSTSVIASLDQSRFAIMLSWSGDEDDLNRFQQRVMQALTRPHQVDGQTVYLSACLGVAIFPNDAKQVDSLLQRADNAMREAQSRGGGVRFHCAETDAAAARKLEIEHLLHEALSSRELTLAYQPIVDVRDGRNIAVEALLRWVRPDGEEILPDQFVVIAEESGLIIRIGEYVLDLVCRQINRWRVAGLEVPTVCVNVARAQLMDAEFPARVEAILRSHQIAPASIELEISERGALRGDYEVVKRLEQLKAIGVRLAIDDFGTGESAIGYLKDLPADALKIDRSYIKGLGNDSRDLAITSAMVAMGQRLDMLVIAEGVETELQREQLVALGCHACQGFLYARPMDPEDFGRHLRQAT